MSAVVGRVWGWVRPALSYRPWLGGSSSNAPPVDTVTVTDKGQKTGGWGFRGLTSWVWGGHKSDQSDQTKLVVEEFWEAEEKLQPMDIEDLCAGKHEAHQSKAEHTPRWWNKILPSSYNFSSSKTESHGLRQRTCASWNQSTWDAENEGDFSDYGTPPPSPTPGSSPLSSTFQLFAQSWKGDILPEHYEICFNLLRHLFDLVVVGFLWTVSPPSKLILEVLGVQGAMRLWLHGMAMFFVSTVGMAGLLWLIQEYLPLVALIYGVIQMLVISVSVRQSVLLGGEEGDEAVEGKDGEALEGAAIKDNGEQREKHMSTVDKIMP